MKLKTEEAEQDVLVEQLIHELGMAHVAHLPIGDPRKKMLSLTNGERKRCAIGVELVSDPSVLLLDEPTSGLDSFKAQSICQLLHNLARTKGKTVVSTIHQPNSEAFFYFDRLVLMCDGHIVYQGDAKKSVDYYKLINCPVPKFANPADFFMRLLSVRYPKSQEDLDKLDHMTRHYHALLEKSVKAEGRLIKLDAPASAGGDFVSHKAPVGVQLRQLLRRSWTLATRDPRLSRAKLFQTVAVILFMIPCFWQLNDYSSIPSV
jgi:ABC-type multidrug transport system ATPase subunit